MWYPQHTHQWCTHPVTPLLFSTLSSPQVLPRARWVPACGCLHQLQHWPRWPPRRLPAVLRSGHMPGQCHPRRHRPPGEQRSAVRPSAGEGPRPGTGGREQAAPAGTWESKGREEIAWSQKAKGDWRRANRGKRYTSRQRCKWCWVYSSSFPHLSSLFV